MKTRTNLPERLSWVLVCAFVCSIPFEKSLWLPGLGTISRGLGILAFAVTAIAAFRRRSPLPLNLALLTAAAWVLWSALTLAWSLAPAATLGRTVTFAQLLCMFWLIWECCRPDAARIPRLLAAYVAGSAVSAALGIFRYFAGQQTYYRRYAAAGFDPNDFGLTIALSIPFGLYLALRSRGPAQWLYRAAIALSIGAVLLSASRSAFIASAAGFLFALLTWREAGRTQRLASMALLAFLILGALRLAPMASRERLATLPAELTSGTLHNRTRIWKAGLKAIKHRPLGGVGAGAYPEAVLPWLGRPGIPGHEYVAHNTFLSVLVEEGLAGFGLFALLLASLVLFVWVMPADWRSLWSVTLLVWAVGVSTLTWEHRKPTWLIFGLIVAAWSKSFEGGKEEA